MFSLIKYNMTWLITDLEYSKMIVIIIILYPNMLKNENF